MRDELVQKIRTLGVPRSTVAKLAGLHLCDVTGYLNGRLDLNEQKRSRVAEVVADIAKVIESFPMKVDLRDPENVRKMIVMVNDARLQMALFNEDAAEDTAQDLPTLRVRALNETPV